MIAQNTMNVQRHRFRQVYSHNGAIGVLVEFALETEFVMRSETFIEMSKNIAMHIAATNPGNVDALLREAFVKDPQITVGAYIETLAKKAEEAISVTRFVRRADDDRPVEVPPSGPAAIIRFQQAP